MKRRLGQPGNLLALVALLWSIGAALLLVVIPSGTSTTTSRAADGTVTTSTSHPTLLETEGSTVLFVLAAPAIVAALGAIPWPRLRQQLRWVSGGLLALGCLAGAMTIGVFYVPAAFMMLVAAGQTPNAFGWPSRRGRRRAAES